MYTFKKQTNITLSFRSIRSEIAGQNEHLEAIS